MAERIKDTKNTGFYAEVDGKVTNASNISDTDWNAIQQSQAQDIPLYYSKSGGYTTNSEDANWVSRIDIDKKANKVTITAPKSVLESDSFKNTFGSSTFKSLSRGYVSDPTAKLTLENGEEKTVEELMNSYREELQSLTSARPTMDLIAKQQEELYGVTGLSDDQIIIAGSSVNTMSGKNDVVYLPAQVIGGYDFSQLESFDKDKMTISKKDFDEFNQSKAFDDERVKKARQEAMTAIQTMAQAKQDKNYKYDDAGKEQAVRWQSFYNSLMGNAPKTSAPVAVANFVEGAIHSFSGVFLDLAENTGKLAENIGENVWIMTPSNRLGLVQFGKTLQALSAVGDMFDNVLYNPNMKAEDAFNKLGLDLKETIGFELSESEQQKFNSISDTIKENITLRENVSGALSAGNFVGNLAGELVKQVILVNPIGGVIGSGVSKTLTKGLSSLTKVTAAAGTAKELGSLATIANNLSSSSARLNKGLESGANLIGKFADIAAQGIADTITKDSDALDKLYSNGETSGIADELISNVFWNGVGELGAFGGSRAMEAVGDTKVGRAISLQYGRAVNELAALKNQAKLAVENRLAKIKVLNDDMGAATREYQQLIINAEKKAAKAKTLEEFNQAIRTRTILENEFDAVRSGGRVVAAEMRSSQQLAKVVDDLDSSSVKLSEAIVKSGDKLMPGSKVSKEVADYLSVKQQLSRALADTKEAGSSWAKSLQERYNSLSSSLRTKGVLDAADSNYDALQRATYQLTEFQLKEGLISADEIESLRETGYWGKKGEEFFHTRRIRAGVGEAESETAETALRNYEQSVGNLNVRKYHAREAEIYNIKKVADDTNFIDPNMVFAGEFYRTAQTLQAKRWGDALLNASGVSKEIGGKAELKNKSRSAQEFNSLQKKIYNSIQKNAGKDYNLNIDDIFPGIKQTKKTTAAALTETSAERRAATQAYNRGVDRYAGMQLGENDIAEILVKGRFDTPSFDPSTMSKAEFDSLVEGLDQQTVKQMQTAITEAVGDGAKLDFDNYRKTYISMDGLELQLQRSYVNNNSNITKSKAYKDTIRRVKKQSSDFVDSAFLNKYQVKYDAITAKYKGLKENPFGVFRKGNEGFLKEVKDMVSGIEEEWGAALKTSDRTKQLYQALIDEGVDGDLATNYLVVDTLYRMRDAAKGNRPLRESIANYLHSDSYYSGIKSGDLNEAADIIADMADDIIESEWNTMTRSLIDNGHKDLVDLDKVFDKVSSYADDILGTMKDETKNIIEILGDDGKIHLVETDPIVKDLYEWRPNYADASPNRFFSLTNRVFRLNTTGLPVTAFYRQWIKDPMNAYVAGGAVPFLDAGMSRFFGGDAYAKISNSVVDSLKDGVIRGLKTEWGDDIWAAFEREVTSRGGDVAREAVEYELIKRPQAISGVEGTETKFYQELTAARSAERAYEYGGNMPGDKQAGKFSKWLEEKLTKAEDLVPNNSRETYLRNLVYQKQYREAISRGKSIQDARIIATRFMNDATTNFGRPLALGNRIARSIPYLNAAFNGKASFMRLLELDPAGVTGRFLGGVVFPYMSLLAESLGKEDNAKVYRNFKEYQKDGSLAFVVNGQGITIPIPDELGAFLNPFRQAVEKSYDANDHSWAELAANDLLQLPVMDLSGFYDIDQEELYNNTDFWSNIGRGTEKLVFGQMSPAIVKSAYMTITGRDPYTGYEIDKSYTYEAEDGSQQVMDSNDNKVASFVSDWAKSIGINLSPSAAYSIIGTTFGKGLLSLGDTVGSLLSGEPTSIGSETVSGVNNVLLTNVRDRGADAWRSAINSAYNDKEKLLHSEEYQNYVKAINNTQISEAKRQQYLSNWKTYTQDYVDKVMNMASTMRDKYGITASQQASVVSLLTFADNTTPQPLASGREESSSIYQTARSQALQTMAAHGFRGTTDLSIFGYGYYTKDPETGEQVYKYKYNSAPAILDMGNTIWGQTEITLGNIKQQIKTSGLDEEYKTFSKQLSAKYDAASSEKNKTAKNNIYKEIDSMAKEWDTKVMKAITPYIDAHGLPGLLNSDEVVNYLEGYIKVPTDFMGQGKYISSKTGLDKNAGYIKAYLKAWYEEYDKLRKENRK